MSACPTTSVPSNGVVQDGNGCTIDYQAVLATMGVHLTQSEANKVAISYTDMTPMDRFLAETCQLEGQAGSRQVAPSSSSCRPTQGSKDGDSRG